MVQLDGQTRGGLQRLLNPFQWHIRAKQAWGTRGTGGFLMDFPCQAEIKPQHADLRRHPILAQGQSKGRGGDDAVHLHTSVSRYTGRTRHFNMCHISLIAFDGNGTARLLQWKRNLSPSQLCRAGSK